MRVRLVRLFLLTLLALLPACAVEREGGEAIPGLERLPPPVPEATREFAGVTITYYGESGGHASRFDAALAEQFEKDTGVRVRYVQKPASTTETYATYARLFQGRSPDVDCMMLDVIWPGAFAPHLYDLRTRLGHLADQYLPQLIENNTVDGRLVAMPGFIDVGLLYYRKDLLQRYGYSAPPRTWDELEEMARTIQQGERAAGNRMFQGFVWQGAPYEGLTCDALEWQVSHGGGRIVDPETGRIQMANPGTIAALARAASWIGDISPIGVISYQEEDSRNVFHSGNAAFMRNWPYAWALENAPDSPVRDKVGVTVLPRGPGPEGRHAACIGGWHLAVSRYSRHPEAAAEFARYWSCPEVQAWRATLGSYLPTIPAVYDRPEVQQAQALYQIIPEVLPYAVPRPSTVTRDLYNEVSAIYFQGVSEVLQGLVEPEAAVTEMEQKIGRAVDYLRRQGDL